YNSVEVAGHYIVAASAESVDGDVTGPIGDQDMWVVDLDTAGAIVWQLSLGGSSYEEANALVATSDSTCFITGITFSNDGYVSGSHGVHETWLALLGDISTEVGGFADRIVSIHPNPTADQVWLTLAPDWSAVRVSIADVQGRTLMDRSASGTGFAVDVSSLPEATYLLTVHATDRSFTRRLVVAR
ncbi:MAG: T9SS type A sorting domain-containing protein, partial [Flavobacteriales bacterium]|nr:T9SS type A sorting domain-containing protein [Flavobacteriales bacterium]